MNGGQLTLKNVTLAYGGAAQGGAIRLQNGARVVIENSTLSYNKATDGGAIATSDVNDHLTILDSSFIGNISEQTGGAIYAKAASVNISGSRFEKNCALFASYALAEGRNSDQSSTDADGCLRVSYVRSQIDAGIQSDVDGGAIRLLYGAQVTVESSTFAQNKASYGGAISSASRDVSLSVKDSSFLENRASQSGGAIGSSWEGGGWFIISNSSFLKNSAENSGGGAIEASRGVFDIANSTFSENRSELNGGALKIDKDAEVTIAHATFVDNQSRYPEAKAIANTGGNVRLRNSIIASSESGEDCAGVSEHAGNLSTDGSCADKPSDALLLGELTGSPAYYPLLDLSPAVDYADPRFCLESDQLGTPRPQGGGCDIGAIESRAAIAAEPTPVSPLVCTLADKIIAANRDRPAGACPAGSGVDTISLEQDITLFAALPAITSSIVIEGNGYSISGEGKLRIFDVDNGILTVKNLTMTKGYGGTGYGGAIRLQNGGRATVRDSKFINNSSSYGGGIYIHLVGTNASWLAVSGSSFVSNRGNAIYAGAGTVSVDNSSFVGNSGQSGVIQVLNPMRLDVTNSSFIKNLSPAIFAENGAIANLTHVTILHRGSAIDTYASAFNSAGQFNLRNSIVTGSIPSAVCDNMEQNISNLIEDGSCSPQFSGDPMLEEATDSSAYLDLMPGSPAINAADAGFCPATDQLGRARSIVGRCDIGAIEVIPVSQALSNCSVSTTHFLNFRDGPGGKIIGGIPQNATLKAISRTPRWYEVEHESASGWISADFVLAQGDCG